MWRFFNEAFFLLVFPDQEKVKASTGHTFKVSFSPLLLIHPIGISAGYAAN